VAPVADIEAASFGVAAGANASISTSTKKAIQKMVKAAKKMEAMDEDVVAAAVEDEDEEAFVVVQFAVDEAAFEAAFEEVSALAVVAA